MSPLIEKIFMLRRHQLIRWGSAQGYLLVALGLALMLAPIGIQIYVRAYRADLETKIADGTRMRRDLLARLKTEDQLRTFAAVSIAEHHKTRVAYQKYISDSLGSTGFIALGLGVALLSTGVLMFRANELASGLEEESRKADILNRQSDN